MAVKQLPAIVFCASVSLATALSQPLGKSVISGAVIDGESGEAIRKAVVTLTLEGTPRRWATTRTDGSGRFLFEGLPAGKYDLRATKTGEGTAIYGANHPKELGEIITLGEGEMRGSLTLRFLHPASISGHVFDSDGEPLADAFVNLLRPGRNLGAPILGNYRGASTNDRGEYQISDVAPGQYYLRATPNARRFGIPPARPQSIWVDQYYGGARDSKGASAVHVAGGESLAGLDFHLISEPAVEVRGKILGVPEESAPASAPQEHSETESPEIQVTLSPAETGQERWTNGTGAQGPEHRFEMADVPAGRYRIEASYQSGNKTYGVSQVFDLNPNSGEVTLTLAPTVDILGTLRVEGHAVPPASRGRGFHIQLSRPGLQSGNGVVSAQVSADGRFSLSGVTPGEWQLSVNPVPPGYLKSAHFGDKDVRFTTFEVGSNGDVPLNVVVSMNTATVEGEIEGDSKRAGILIAPVGLYYNLVRFYYGTPSDSGGKFHLAGIAPGRYKIFALEKMAAASFRTPEAADLLDELGEVIDVAEGATVQAHPKLISADRAAQALK